MSKEVPTSILSENEEWIVCCKVNISPEEGTNVVFIRSLKFKRQSLVIW